MKIKRENVYYASKCKITLNLHSKDFFGFGFGENGVFSVETVCIEINENQYIDILDLFTLGKKAKRYSTTAFNNEEIFFTNLRPFYEKDLSSEVSVEEIYKDKINREFCKDSKTL